MCRAEVAPAAQNLLGELLDTIAHRLADREHVDRDQILIGPVDLGGYLGPCCDESEVGHG